MRPFVAAAAVAVSLALIAPRASGFCGFYVSGAGAELFNEATQVVLMREGLRTVLSMQNTYKGPPSEFALVVPVPVILQQENVKTLPRDVFDHVDRLGAPRLVEYWEEDPCAPEGIGLGNIGILGHGAGIASVGATGADRGVKIEAQFAVGEYQIVVLSAKDAAGLDTWLREQKYRIPEGAEPYLRPYVAGGSKFFVAKVDPAKVVFQDGRAMLSPLRFHYDTPTFSLPVRLGLVNSSGAQDLVVNILARGKRFEVANYPNVTIPTNLDVSDATRARFGEFYAALFDRTLEKNPKAIVTEYAWDAGTCDPCPLPALSAEELATLGADVLEHGTDGLAAGAPSVRVLDANGSTGVEPEVVQRVGRRNAPRIRACYEAALQKNPRAGGRIAARLDVDNGGAVRNVTLSTPLGDANADACLRRAFASFELPPETGKATAVIAWRLDRTGGGPARASGYVLTRLHARYTKEALGEDLVFKAVDPIVGGREREGVDGGIEQGAAPDLTNNFQARYAIRHPWTGPVACAEPKRGRWQGTPPPAWDGGEAGGTSVATGLAFARKGKVDLAAFTLAATSPPAPAASPGAVDAAASSTPAAPAKSGCAGCAIGARDRVPEAMLAVLASLVAFVWRRRRA